MTQENKSADAPENYAALKALKAKLVISLRTIGKQFQADDLERCHEAFRGFRCKPNAHQWARPVLSCQFKLCPFCMKARRARSLARYRNALADRSKRWRFVTLTIRNTRYLDEGLEKLWKAFERLRHRVIWKRNVRGAIVRGEITWNKVEKTWHPHVHILYDGEFIPWAYLVKQWEECTRGEGQAPGQNIQEIEFDRMGEVVKYITKVGDFADEPDALHMFLLDTRGHRFVRCYGDFYGIESEDEEAEPFVCPDCGSREIESVGFVFPDQLHFDFGGRLRFRTMAQMIEDESPPARGPDARISEESFTLRYEHPRLFADAAD